MPKKKEVSVTVGNIDGCLACNINEIFLLLWSALEECSAAALNSMLHFKGNMNQLEGSQRRTPPLTDLKNMGSTEALS